MVNVNAIAGGWWAQAAATFALIWFQLKIKPHHLAKDGRRWTNILAISFFHSHSKEDDNEPHGRPASSPVNKSLLTLELDCMWQRDAAMARGEFCYTITANLSPMEERERMRGGWKEINFAK